MLFFRLDYVLETDLSHLERHARDRGLPKEMLRALGRKADGWFPPERRVVDLTADLGTDIQREIRDLLQLPYSKNTGSYRDYNLDSKRLWALDELVSREFREDLYRQVRESSENLVRGEESVVAKCLRCSERADNEKQRRMDQLRIGLAFSGQSTAELADEEQLYDLIIKGIRNPMIRPDSIGLIVLSGSNPFEAGGSRC